MKESKKVINYNKYLVAPLDVKVKNFQSIVKYFLYYTPNLKCIHSKIQLNEKQQEKCLNEMLNIAQIKKYRFMSKAQKKSYENLDLYGEQIPIDDIRFLCTKKNKETEFEALIRHLRNCFAHGNMAYIKNKSIFILYDKDDKNITAKFVLTKKILEDWKACLENIIV